MAWDVLCENAGSLATPGFHAGVRALLGTYTTVGSLFSKIASLGIGKNKCFRIPAQPLRHFHNQLGTAIWAQLMNASGLSTH